jgi:hypothetical protein
VATRAGLFQSNDAGATYNLTALPNTTAAVAQSAWSIAYVGGTTWLVTGVTACSATSIPPRYVTYPGASCTLGAPGDMWRSTDSGATWTSLRGTTGALPLTANDPVGAGRMTLAVGNLTKAPNTVVYAWVEGGSPLAGGAQGDRTRGYWRSTDGGATWKDATGTLANPTLSAFGQPPDCGDTNAGHGQAWYNQAIAVDPTNDDNVIVGGNLCSLRTFSGTSAAPVWENVSHWLPSVPQIGTTTGGVLPYAHADWHTITAFTAGGKVHVLAGNDGGVYESTNVFDTKTTPPNVVWTTHNKGLATELMYHVGSGDPANADAFSAIAGLQDNGTYIRQRASNPTLFNGIFGGDGIGAAIHQGTTPVSVFGNQTVGEFIWASAEFTHVFCVAAPNNTCSFNASGNGGNWWVMDPPIAAGDGQPFFVHYSPILTDTTGAGFLTNSRHQVWRTNLPPGADVYDCNVANQTCQMSWQAVSPDFSTTTPAHTIMSTVGTPVVAARGQATTSGAVFRAGARFGVTSAGAPAEKTAP